jgi:hypothetical protein
MLADSDKIVAVTPLTEPQPRNSVTPRLFASPFSLLLDRFRATRAPAWRPKNVAQLIGVPLE